MTPITAQFLHQHKDKIVCQQTILIGSLRFECHGGKVYFAFEIPVANLLSHDLKVRWFDSYCLRRITKRSMRFLDSDGKVLYQLSKRPLKAKLDPNNRKYNMLVIEVTCKVEKDEIRELSKIFSK